MPKRRKKHREEERADERWLLTYADMITLLMALFMVLFSISSVNTSKFASLQRALESAFSGRVLPGGEALKETGGQTEIKAMAASPPRPSLERALGDAKQLGRQGGQGAAAEQRDLQRLKEQIDAFVVRKGLRGKVETALDPSGLSVRVLSDDLLFASGRADLQAPARPLMARLGQILRLDGRHPVRVEGHTDHVPIRSARYPTNWELSTARASAVVRAFARERVAPGRMEAAGRASLDPVATNATEQGRGRNRRVEILVPRTEGGT